MATAQELLTLVDAAITAKLTGGAVDSYSMGGVNISTASLETLMNLRKDLQAQVDEEASEGDFALANLRI